MERLGQTAIERLADECLAAYLLRNAEALGVDQGQMARLREAYRLDVSLLRRDRDEGRRIANAVQRELQAALGDLVEAIKSRGEKIADFNNVGAKRIKTRDGLASLVDSGTLTKTDAAVGLAYRLLYEQAGVGAGLGSQLEDRPRAIRDSSHGAVAAGLYRAYAGVRMTGVDTAVAAADRTGRALSVLRAVAGEGRTIRSLGDGGNTKKANLLALQLALRIALAALQGNGGLRIGAR